MIIVGPAQVTGDSVYWNTFIYYFNTYPLFNVFVEMTLKSRAYGCLAEAIMYCMIFSDDLITFTMQLNAMTSWIMTPTL